MAGQRTVRKLILALLSLVIAYYLINIISLQIRLPKQEDDSHSIEDIMTRSTSVHPTSNKQVIHLAVILLDPDSCREFELLLKTVLYHRHHHLYLHILSTNISEKIGQRLLETWDLPQVNWTFTDVTKLKVSVPSVNTESFLQTGLPFILPNTITKVIYLSNRMRILNDIYHLWEHFNLFKTSHTYGILPAHKAKKTPGSFVDVMMLDLTKFRQELTGGLQDVLLTHKKGSKIQDVYSKLFHKNAYILPCLWGIGLNLVETMCQLNEPVKALVWDPHENIFSANRLLEWAKEKTLSILISDGGLYRRLPSTLSPPHFEFDSKDKCLEYRHEAMSKRRTHLYYIGPPLTYQHKQTDSNDITLLTQFTLDRFDTFERFMANWEGPVNAVLYVTDTDALDLPQRIASSTVLAKRKNIAYHLVYKRGKFYPINYLRNVALNETWTPYLLFVDVDLVVNQGLYVMLKRYIKQFMMNNSNVTLVVPAFESFTPLLDFPRNKSELLQLMDTKKVIGYRMNRGWNLGHKATDYPKWMKANKTYQVIWKDAYEPYVVLASKSAPLYREILLERMGDKIAYGREIYARGYQFWVLPDVFLVHLPHSVSAGTTTWKSYRGYARCGSLLFDEYRNVLKKQYPNVKF